MKKVFVLLVLILATVLVIAACSPAPAPTPTEPATPGAPAPAPEPPADTGETFTLIMGGTVPDDHPISIAAHFFVTELNERSEGRFEATFFSNNQIGGNRELIEGVQLGTIQMGESSIAPFAAFTDQFLPLSLPFLFPSREVAYAFIDGALAEEIVANVLADTGIMVLGFYENGIRQLTNSIRPIREPADLAGVKIRVMDSPIFLNMFEAMGASPMPMAFAEVFTALQQGTIDGQDNPYINNIVNRLYEVQPYMTDLGHVIDLTAVFICPDFFNSLPAELRDLLLEVKDEAVALNRRLSVEVEDESLAYLQEHLYVTFLTPAERQAFRDSVEPTYDWFRATHGDGMLDRILEEIEGLS